MTDHRNTDSIYAQQVNINSIRNKKEEVKIILDQYKFQGKKVILLINDTRLNSQENLNFDGFYSVRKDLERNTTNNTHSPGGVLAIIPNSITTKEIQEFRDLGIETIGLELSHKN